MKVLIFGGSGTFGTAMTKRIVNKVDKIIHYDRNEKNQFISKQNVNSENIIRIIGDIRDKEAVDNVINTYKPSTVMLASAMKHIDKCELNPNECKKTNINGAINVINSCIEHNIKKLVFLSTDKAPNPTTLYGSSKDFVEKYIQAVDSKNTTIITTRYGNVLGSNGSVLDIWRKQKENNEPLTITNPNMTRFFMSINQAVDLVLYALKHGNNKDLWVYNNKSCSIQDLANYISDNQIEIGVRCIEKNDEALLTITELEHSELINDIYYRVNKDIKGKPHDIPFTSDTATKFNKEELGELVNEIISDNSGI